MKKLSRHIFAVILACILLIMTTDISYAVDDGDPGDKCYIAVPYNAIYNNK